MRSHQLAIGISAIVTAGFASGLASAQPAAGGAGSAYPNRPIRMVTSTPGGASDFAARLVAQGIGSRLPQPIIVDNKGGGTASVEIVAKAPPNGYTLYYSASLLWMLPLLQDHVSFDTFRDFATVSLVVSSPIIVVSNPTVAARSIRELIALAKAKPGALNYGSGGSGSTGHMSMELFKYMAGVDIVRVPFKGGGPALTAVMSGDIELLMTAPSELGAHIKSGRVRALAVSGARRFSAFPDLPTVAESGVPGYEYEQMSGIFAPAKTPKPIIELLNGEIVRALGRAEVREQFLNTGLEVVGSSPEQFEAKIKGEMDRLGKVIKAAGIHVE